MPLGADQGASWRAAAGALNEAGDKGLRTAVYKHLDKVARPLGIRVIAQGAAVLPHRGGLSARVAASRLTVSKTTTGRDPSVSIRVRSSQGYDLKAMDRGQLRHPVFARQGAKRTWVRQSIRAGAFTVPFEAGAGPVRDELLHAMQEVADGIASAASRGSHG